MSTPIKPITLPSTETDFSAYSERSYANYADHAINVDLSNLLLPTRDVDRPGAASSEDASPLLNIVMQNGQSRNELRRDIAHINAGHSDPTMVAVQIREVNQKMGELALQTQVAMKVEQGGVKTIEKLLGGG